LKLSTSCVIKIFFKCLKRSKAVIKETQKCGSGIDGWPFRNLNSNQDGVKDYFYFNSQSTAADALDSGDSKGVVSAVSFWGE